MPTTAYQSALQIAEALSHEEQLRLIRELESRTLEAPESGKKHSILEFEGVGKEIWQGIDAQEFVNQERASWDK
jgi:hypothetical protein